MQLLEISELRSGMLVGRTILQKDGNPLLIMNSFLNDDNIRFLQEHGLQSVYVKSTLADIDIPSDVSYRIRASVSKVIKGILTPAIGSKGLKPRGLKKSIAMLVDDIAVNPNLLMILEDIRSYNDYLLSHSINVSILSMVTAMKLGYPDGVLLDLGIGALFHDIGMLKIAPEIVNKKGELSPDEIREVKRHPEIGFNMLKSYSEASVIAPHIAFQHHERWDGSGYPRRLSRNKITEYARIVAVADVFDALSSPRSYRKPYTIKEVITIMSRLADTYFDPLILKSFLTNFTR